MEHKVVSLNQIIVTHFNMFALKPNSNISTNYILFIAFKTRDNFVLNTISSRNKRRTVLESRTGLQILYECWCRPPTPNLGENQFTITSYTATLNK